MLDLAVGIFLDAGKVKLLDLIKTKIDELQFTIAHQFLESWYTGQGCKKVILGQFVSNYTSIFNDMPVVLTAFKHALIFGALTVMCENTFSTLKNVFSE